LPIPRDRAAVDEPSGNRWNHSEITERIAKDREGEAARAEAAAAATRRTSLSASAFAELTAILSMQKERRGREKVA